MYQAVKENSIMVMVVVFRKLIRTDLDIVPENQQLNNVLAILYSIVLSAQ